jgi:hypothetical protein
MPLSRSTLVSTSTTFAVCTALLVAAASPAVSGCGDGSSDPPMVTVGAVASVFGTSTQALRLTGFTFINGVYGDGCLVNHGLSWSLGIAGTGTATNAPLSVVLNNTACVLTVTSIDATDAGGSQNYTPTGSFALGDSYSTGVAFAPASGVTAFYGAAELSPADFSGPFALTFKYSDDPTAMTGSNMAVRATVAATGGGSDVASPDYRLTEDPITTMSVTTDANDVVQSVSGNVGFTTGSQPGESYVVVPGALADDPPTFAEDDAAFQAGGTPVATSAGLPIAAVSFLTAGTDTLPQTRTVLFLHASSGVRAYESVTITFSEAP